MGRILIHGLLLILPFLLYGLYLWQVKRAGREGPETTPWFWLSVIGMLLLIASFAYYGFMHDDGASSYTPARWQGGAIQPGETK